MSFTGNAPLGAAEPAPAAANVSRSVRRAIGFLVFLFLAGSISTALWLGSAGLPDAAGGPYSLFSAGAMAALALCLALTSLNLAIRWFRWQFLIRRFTRNVLTRDSLAVYLATLPAIVTPFFIGELVRVLILRRRSGTRTAALAWVWLIERAIDAAVLLLFLLLSLNRTAGLAALPVLAVATFLLLRLVLNDRGTRAVATAGSVALAATIVAWLLPALALLATLGLVAQPVPFLTALKAFAGGTLSGGASGFPLGVSITGSAMIEELVRSGVDRAAGVLGVLIHRTGTAWYAVFLGVACFVLFRRRLAHIVRGGGAGHFDQIAHEYDAQIPEQVRDRLLHRKTALIRQQLAELGIPAGARGLDIGCGQGRYLGELARAGYRMHGVDYSIGQLREAAANLRATGAPAVPLLQGDAQALPFPDGWFDFAYSINAFHHLPSPEAQLRAAAEVVRVLRPGGAFVLHEINTENPVFRLYVGYLFPLLKAIDEGTEHWILPSRLLPTTGAEWLPEVRYFTFIPDFVSTDAEGLLGRVERSLERSALRRYSAHYQACLVRR